MDFILILHSTVTEFNFINRSSVITVKLDSQTAYISLLQSRVVECSSNRLIFRQPLYGRFGGLFGRRRSRIFLWFVRF